MYSFNEEPHEERQNFVGLSIRLAFIWNDLLGVEGVMPLSLPEAFLNLGLCVGKVTLSPFPFSLPLSTASGPPSWPLLLLSPSSFLSLLPISGEFPGAQEPSS